MTLRRLRLRTILLFVNLVVLALPLGGIAVLRIYESALIRQTETELIAQAAFVAASYRAALRNRHPHFFTSDGYGHPVDERWLHDDAEPWRPRPAVLDLAIDRIRPPAPEPMQAGVPDAIAASIGGELSPVLRDAQLVTLAAIRVVDAEGVIVASTGDHFGLSLAHREEISRALEGENVSLLRARDSEEPTPPLSSISRGTQVRTYVVMPIVLRNRVLGAVALIRTPKNIVQALYGKRVELAVGALLLLGVAVLISLFTSFAISRPVRGLIIQARRAMSGERGAMVPLAHPVTREVEHLSERLAEMARTLESRAEYIQTFAQHVSHEFKTPLASIHGTVELLSEHAQTMTEGERDRFLNNLSEDAARLSALVSRLLELARADVATPGDGERAQPLTVLETLVGRYGERGLEIVIDAGGDSASDRLPDVALGTETLESILASMLDNALQHGAGRVEVTLVPDEGGVVIAIDDDGPGISPANAERVFEPFFTTARETGGTGLGLTVVRSLLGAHGASIDLAHGDTGGARFELVLPAAPA